MKGKITILLYIVILIILIIISRNILAQHKKDSQHNITFEEEIKKVSNYNKNNLNRYLKYKKENKNLSNNEIITHVNIGLDNKYYTNIKNAPKQNTALVIVNKYNKLSEDYIPQNLEQLNSKYSNNEMKLVSEARLAFEALAAQAEKENLTIIAMSTYRSYSYQKSLYNKYKEKDGEKVADTYSARPGHSEHQTGLAVDVYNKKETYTNFELTEEFKWMRENAHKYGYILRYPKSKEYITGYQYEPWHYRYVGIEIATYINNHNITLEEYFVTYLDK